MMGGIHHHHTVNPSDLDVLDAISSMPMRGGPSSAHMGNGLDLQQRKRNLDTLHALRRPPIDPIVLAASLSSGPHVTRHHFHHSFGPKVQSKQMARSERDKLKEKSEEHADTQQNQQKFRDRAGSYANCDRPQVHDRPSSKESSPQQVKMKLEERQSLYLSTQGPRSERLRKEQEAKTTMEKLRLQSEEKSEENWHDIASKSEKSAVSDGESNKQRGSTAERGSVTSLRTLPNDVTDAPTMQGMSSIARAPPISVRCYVRTRIPTPHGEVFCHLYRNNRDNKEHLALVVDTAQNAVGGSWENDADAGEGPSRSIRSRTLDEVWGPHETEMERIVRGAYAGRLGPNHQVASKASSSRSSQVARQESPLVRIHSECYTGETIGSQRCDCGEQLDEAIRLIHSDSQPARGVVVYLRQEGRGIGLLDKLMAYNLQDMGHDTVSANILLGHLADARKYDVAAEILRDLGVGSCRLLTNNPEKMEALESEGITVEARVPMVPRVWRQSHSHIRSARKSKPKRRPRGLEESIVSQLDDSHQHSADYEDDSDDGSDASRGSYVDHILRRSGATAVGASMTRGPELEKYLRTKVQRMGHLLDLPPDQTSLRKQASSTFSLVGEAPLTDEDHHVDTDDLHEYSHDIEADDEDDEILVGSVNREGSQDS